MKKLLKRPYMTFTNTTQAKINKKNQKKTKKFIFRLKKINLWPPTYYAKSKILCHFLLFFISIS